LVIKDAHKTELTRPKFVKGVLMTGHLFISGGGGGVRGGGTRPQKIENRANRRSSEPAINKEGIQEKICDRAESAWGDIPGKNKVGPRTSCQKKLGTTKKRLTRRERP